MKSIFVSALLITATAGVAQAEPSNSAEVSYPKGSIGYDALMAGENDKAISQIISNERVSRHDPAKLINLGQAYARTGRISEAAGLFATAMQSREDVDLVLADGRVMNSKEAASRALSSLQTKVQHADLTICNFG